MSGSQLVIDVAKAVQSAPPSDQPVQMRIDRNDGNDGKDYRAAPAQPIRRANTQAPP